MSKRTRRVLRYDDDEDDEDYVPEPAAKQARVAQQVIDDFFAALPDEMVREVHGYVSGDIRVLLRTLATVDKRSQELTSRVFYAFYVRDIWSRVNREFFVPHFPADVWKWAVDSLLRMQKWGALDALPSFRETLAHTLTHVTGAGGDFPSTAILRILAEPLPAAPRSAAEAHEQKLYLASQYKAVADDLAETLARTLLRGLTDMLVTPGRAFAFAARGATRPLFSLARRLDAAGQIMPVDDVTRQMALDYTYFGDHGDEQLVYLGDLVRERCSAHKVKGANKPHRVLVDQMRKLLYMHALDVVLIEKDGRTWLTFTGLVSFGLPRTEVAEETRALFLPPEPRW